jgi:two-component system NtrC family sensor kinase
VLIVDDNARIHEDFSRVLRTIPSAHALDAAEAALFETRPTTEPVEFEVDFAESGEAALARVERATESLAPYCVAFVDIQMPGWDGVRTVRELWCVDPRIQIVLCTAYSDHTWEDLDASLGPSDSFLVLKKPFDTIEVRQAASALTQKWMLAREKESRLVDLEREVATRTAELVRANARLKEEMIERLRHARKLEALGRVAASVAHEINNPLAYILCNLDFCREALSSEGTPSSPIDVPSLSQSIEEAAAGAERIRRIVLDIRLFSHPREEPLGSVDVETSIRSVVRMLGNDIRRRARLEESYGPVSPVFAEPNRLEQVLTNLLANAAHALPEGSIDSSIHIVTRAQDDEVFVEIRDNGHGISEEDLAKIFEPFFTTRSSGSGTGLGLSICRGIIEGFGGRIEIESRVGEGTTVRLCLRASGSSKLALDELVALASDPELGVEVER